MLIPLRASPCAHIDIEREYEVTYARHYSIDTGNLSTKTHTLRTPEHGKNNDWQLSVLARVYAKAEV